MGNMRKDADSLRAMPGHPSGFRCRTAEVSGYVGDSLDHGDMVRFGFAQNAMSTDRVAMAGNGKSATDPGRMVVNEAISSTCRRVVSANKCKEGVLLYMSSYASRPAHLALRISPYASRPPCLSIYCLYSDIRTSLPCLGAARKALHTLKQPSRLRKTHPQTNHTTYPQSAGHVGCEMTRQYV